MATEKGLVKRGKYYHYDFWYSNEHYRGTTRCQDRPSALKVLIKKKQEAIDHEQDALFSAFEISEENDMTFKEAGRKVYALYFDEQRSAYATLTKLGVLEQIIGETMVSKIDAMTFNYVEGKLKLRGCSANTINKYFSTMNVVLEVSSKKLGAPCHPVNKVNLTIKRKSIRSISDREEKKVIEWLSEKAFKRTPREAWRHHDLVEIYQIGVATGMRRGEIFSFTVDQIHGQTIQLDPEQHKTGDLVGTKSIILSKDALELIDKRIERMKLEEGDRVFPYSKEAFTKLWNKMKKEIGLSNDRRFTPHCMRHTFATRMAKAGMPIYHVSKMLGHTTVKTTEMYSHLFKDELVEAMNKVTQ